MTIRITDLTLLVPAIDTADVIEFVDVSDTAQNAAGSSYKINMTQLRGFIGGSWQDGTIAAPGAKFLSEAGLGIHRPSAGIAALVQGGLVRAGWDASGLFSGTGITGDPRFLAGSTSDPAITFIGDLNTGLKRPSADTLALVGGGVDKLLLDGDTATVSDSNGDIIALVRNSEGGVANGYWDIQSRGNLSAFLIAQSAGGADNTTAFIGGKNAGTVQVSTGGSGGVSAKHVEIGSPGVNYAFGVQNFVQLLGADTGQRVQVGARGNAGLELRTQASAGDILFTAGNGATTLGQLLVAGMEANGYTFVSDDDTGLVPVSAGFLALRANGTNQLETGADGLVRARVGYRFTGDTNTGLSNPAADQVALRTGGVDRVIVENTKATFFGGIEIDDASLITGPKFTQYGLETNAAGSQTGAVTVNMNNGNAHDLTVTGNVTSITITNPPQASGDYVPLIMKLRNSTAGPFNLPDPLVNNGDWGSNAKLTTLLANSSAVVTAHTLNAGTSWELAVVGDGYAA